MDQLKKQHVLLLLQSTNSPTLTAGILGVDRGTVYDLCKKYGIQRGQWQATGSDSSSGPADA